MLLCAAALCQADETVTATVVVYYREVGADITCDNYSDLKFVNKPDVQSDNALIVDSARRILEQWKPGTLNPDDFANLFLAFFPDEAGRQSPNCDTCEESNGLQLLYNLEGVITQGVTTIRIKPYSASTITEPAIPIVVDVVDSNIASLYAAEAIAPGLTEQQKKQLSLLAGKIAGAAYKAEIRTGILQNGEAIKPFEAAERSEFGLGLPDPVRVTVIKDFSRIELSDFPLIERIDVCLTNWRERIDELRRQGTPRAARAAEEYAQKADKREAEAQQWIMQHLPDPGTQVLSSAQVENAKNAWHEKAKTAFTDNVIEPMSTAGVHNRLVLQANEPIRTVNGEAAFGGRYSTETRFQTTASGKVDNLADNRDSLAIQGAWGREATDLSGSWKTDVITFDDGHKKGTFSLSAAYSHNDRVPFGQLSTTRIEERTWDVGLSATYSVDGFLDRDQDQFKKQAENRRMVRRWRSYTVGAAVNHFEGRQDETTAADLDTKGSSLTLGTVFGMTRDVHTDATSRVSHYTGSMRLGLEKGLKAGGGENSFVKTSVQPEAEAYFGPAQDSRDFLVRVLGRAGTMSGDTPYSALFRLGGNDGVRGLEEAELTAESYLGSSQEAGVRVSRIIPSFKQDTVYLTIFHDWMRARRPDPAQAESTAAHGYGIALELERISVPGGKLGRFSFGYAYSPDSRLNKRGTIHAEFKLDFY